MVIKSHGTDTNLSSGKINIPAEEETLDYVRRKNNSISNRLTSKRIVSGVRKTAGVATSKVVDVATNVGNSNKQTSEEKELGNARKLVRHAVNDTRLFAQKARRIIKSQRPKSEKKIDDSEYQGNRGNKDDAEYQGNRQGRSNSKKTAATVGGFIFVKLLALMKAIVSAMTNIIVIVVVAVVIIASITVAILQNITYGFVVDEEAHIREIMSNVTYELTTDINSQKAENECDIVSTSGALSDWKEVIALWWTLKNHLSETESWDNHFSGADQDDIEYIFYQFNHIEYEVIDNTTDENSTGHKILNVKITNTSLDELRTHWGLTDSQNRYLDNLLADEEIWEEILGTTELSRIAYSEIGCTSDKYITWYGDGGTDGDISTMFVVWCLAQTGCINDAYLAKTCNGDELMKQFFDKGFIKLSITPSEGDVVFLNINGSIQVGIVTYVSDDNNVTISMLGYTGHAYVEEIVLSSDSALINCYGRVSGFFVEGLGNYNGIRLSGGQFVWPASGCYYVTSAFKWRWGRPHQGTDIGTPVGTPILAAADGTVVGAGWSDSMGNYVLISHSDELQTIYMHNSELCVEAGTIVYAGQQIAYAGNTGNSTGPHCHFGVKLNGTYVDPAPYLGIPEGFEGDATQYLD